MPHIMIGFLRLTFIAISGVEFLVYIVSATGRRDPASGAGQNEVLAFGPP